MTKSRVTFEYIVIDGVNDSIYDAKRLANLIRGPLQHGDYRVNLISYNPVPGVSLKKPTPERLERFEGILKDRPYGNTFGIVLFRIIGLKDYN